MDTKGNRPVPGGTPAGGRDFALEGERLRETRRREGRYLLRTNLDADDRELL